MSKQHPHEVLKVLGNKHRYKIVGILRDGEKNVASINKHIPVSQPALSQHLGKLRAKGILGARRDKRQIFYFIINQDVLKIMALGEKVGGANEKAKAKK